MQCFLRRCLSIWKQHRSKDLLKAFYRWKSTLSVSRKNGAGLSTLKSAIDNFKSLKVSPIKPVKTATQKDYSSEAIRQAIDLLENEAKTRDADVDKLDEDVQDETTPQLNWGEEELLRHLLAEQAWNRLVRRHEFAFSIDFL